MAGTTTLLSNSLAVCLLTIVCTAQAADRVDCPRVHTDGKKTGDLTGADLFQGPPEKKASMIPDLDTWTWELHGYQQNSEERGESLYLVCHYKGIKATVSIEVPRGATFCKVDGTKHGAAAFCGTNADARRKQLAKHD
jgi:hypothetical protein